jgi:hypothetical protein
MDWSNSALSLAIRKRERMQKANWGSTSRALNTNCMALVRDAEDKTNSYRNHIEPFKIARVKKASRKFCFYFRKDGIFIR